MVFQTCKSGITEKEKKNESNSILLLAYYIADVSCLINRTLYMRTLSLIEINGNLWKLKYINKKNQLTCIVPSWSAKMKSPPVKSSFKYKSALQTEKRKTLFHQNQKQSS